MFCKECGVQMEAGVNSCPSCGATVKEPSNLNYTLTIISLVCGILAVLSGGSIAPLAAIITGIIALVKDKTNKLAWVGIGLGACRFLIDLCIIGLVLVIYVVYFVFFFFIMMMASSGGMYI